MGNAAKKIQEEINKTTGEIKETPAPKKKPERTPEETANLKRSFQLGFNDYVVGSVKDYEFKKLYTHCFQGDGDYVIVNNRIGNFYSKMRELDRPGLPVEIGNNIVKLKVPKIPSLIYHQIVAFFKDIADEMGNAEAFIQVYYDTQESKYVCHVPEQTVSSTSVRYDATKNLSEIDRDRYIFVFEIHSHNTMGAFFSGTDNADEKETRFYGVLGKIKSETIEEKYRYLVMGKEFLLTKEDIFDFTGEEVITKQTLMNFVSNQGTDISKEDIYKLLSGNSVSYPKKWKKNVKKPVYTGGSGYVGGKPGGHSYSHGGHSNHGTNDLEAYNDYGHGYYNHSSEKKAQDMDMNMMDTYNSDAPCDEMNTVDVDETFDINNYEEEIHPIIIETFVANMFGNHVEMLLDALTEYGHDGLLQYRARV